MTPEEYARKLSDTFHATFMESQGIKVLTAAGGRARATVALSPGVAQPTGLFHAGAIIGLADTTATVAALSETNPAAEARADLFPLAIQLSSNLMRNAKQGALTADAEIIHRGKTTMVVNTRVIDDLGRLVANVVVTLLMPPGVRAN
ncbi:MAG: PaaI family thioesterase [Candidatus Binataceae bacterium]